MSPWTFIAGLASAASYLVGRYVVRRKGQRAAANSAGLAPVADLTHLPESLQRTALWNLSDGGFERRVVFGEMSRGPSDVAVTAFDLETLRDRRGEWAWLPVDRPFRINGTVSVVVCELDRTFPHVLFKRDGKGDELADDDLIDRATTHAKRMRMVLGLARSYAAEMPALPTAPLTAAVPEHWRVYSRAADQVDVLLAGGFGTTLATAGRRDLVVELLDSLVVIYPAALDVVGADAFADLTTTALQIVDGLLAAAPALTPRGVADHKTAP